VTNDDEFQADFSDQSGIFDPKTFSETVTVIGCGGIGASLLPTLVTMGVKKIVLFDDDLVEPRNIASQLLYRPSDLYKSKVDVCADYLREYGATDVEAHKRFYSTDDTPQPGVVIGAVDSMKARQEIWGTIDGNPDVQLYLDGRIGGESLALYAVDPLEGDWYGERHLYNDDKAMPLPCTERAIVYPATILGGLMCRHLAHFHSGEQPAKIVNFTTSDLFFQEVVN
jgi:hypothetical protein